MNHFMLPMQGDNNCNKELSNAARYGNFAMEQMINDILRNGGSRDNLEVKIFGGGKVMKGMTDVGKRNINFVRDYIKIEGYNLVAEDVGGMYPRKVIFTLKMVRFLLKSYTVNTILLSKLETKTTIVKFQVRKLRVILNYLIRKAN